MLELLDSILPLLVHTAPSSSQSVVGGNSTVTSPFPDGFYGDGPAFVWGLASRFRAFGADDGPAGDGEHVVADVHVA